MVVAINLCIDFFRLGTSTRKMSNVWDLGLGPKVSRTIIDRGPDANSDLRHSAELKFVGKAILTHWRGALQPPA